MAKLELAESEGFTIFIAFKYKHIADPEWVEYILTQKQKYILKKLFI